MKICSKLRKPRPDPATAAEADPWIQLIHRTDLLGKTTLVAAAEAVETQVRTQLAPAWDVGEHAVIEYIGPDQSPSDEAWWCVVLDTPDVAGALGYHDVTAEGRPLAKCFTRPSVTYDLPISGTISHEICEQLVDQRINLWASDGRGTLYALESSDSVQGNDYQLNGATVADFVLPSFFHAADPTGPYDWCSVVEQPFQTMPAGYQLVINPTGAVQQVFGRDRASLRPPAGSRRDRRMRGQADWRRSVWT